MPGKLLLVSASINSTLNYSERWTACYSAVQENKFLPARSGHFLLLLRKFAFYLVVVLPIQIALRTNLIADLRAQGGFEVIRFTHCDCTVADPSHRCLQGLEMRKPDVFATFFCFLQRSLAVNDDLMLARKRDAGRPLYWQLLENSLGAYAYTSLISNAHTEALHRRHGPDIGNDFGDLLPNDMPVIGKCRNQYIGASNLRMTDVVDILYQPIW